MLTSLTCRVRGTQYRGMRHPWYAYLILAASTTLVGGVGGWVMWTLHPAAGGAWITVALGLALTFGLAQLKNR